MNEERKQAAEKLRQLAEAIESGTEIQEQNGGKWTAISETMLRRWFVQIEVYRSRPHLLEGYVNVYPSGVGMAIHGSKAEAEYHAGPDVIRVGVHIREVEE